jgi:hypothetical protein
MLSGSLCFRRTFEGQRMISLEVASDIIEGALLEAVLVD